MKRLLAVLTVCAVMTGVFASCGDDKKEESESKKDVSVSESSDEEATEETEPTTEEETEPETEEETEPETEEETEPETEEETESETEEETESETEEETESETIDLSDATIEGSIDGLWMADNDLYGFSFESGGTGGILADATEKMHFTADGGLAISTVTVEPESVNYDGTTLSVEVEGNDMLTMIRNGESAPDSYDGEYTLISGALYDGMAASMAQCFVIS